MREAGKSQAGLGFGWHALSHWLRARLGRPEAPALTSRERAIEQLRARIRRERWFEPKPVPPKEWKSGGVTAYRFFTRIYSRAVYGSAHLDPKGYDRFHPPVMTNVDLGREARAALLASRFITPDHPEWDTAIRFPTDEEIRVREGKLKRRAGVSSRKALYAGAGFVSLSLQDRLIRIRPSRYAGRGGWEGIPGIEPTTLPESVSNEELGAAINVALELSRNASWD